jgi:DUF1707 SHOCT-like domain
MRDESSSPAQRQGIKLPPGEWQMQDSVRATEADREQFRAHLSDCFTKGCFPDAAAYHARETAIMKAVMQEDLRIIIADLPGFLIPPVKERRIARWQAYLKPAWENKRWLRSWTYMTAAIVTVIGFIMSAVFLNVSRPEFLPIALGVTGLITSLGLFIINLIWFCIWAEDYSRTIRR